MKKQDKQVLARVWVWLGVILLVAATSLLGLWQWNIHTSKQQAEAYVQTLETLLPEPQGAAIEERKDNRMPMLSLEGTDFVGIIEMPRYQSTLPVCADLGQVTKYPCRFDGSIYDRTMQIGATTQVGQYDFYREISVGDEVYFTDMEGNRYTYTVTDLRYAKKVDKSTLEQAALTLFIKNIYDFEYLIVYCND